MMPLLLIKLIILFQIDDTEHILKKQGISCYHFILIIFTNKVVEYI